MAIGQVRRENAALNSGLTVTDEQSPAALIITGRTLGMAIYEGDIADAQLLYFFAAREGHGPSAFVLAGLYDPVGFDANTSLMDEPDGFQAFKWYSAALEAGEEEAAGRLVALKAWSKKAAAEGNEDASHLLLQWEQ